MSRKISANIKEYYIPSSNNIDKLYLRAFIPYDEPKGYIQFVHDSYEHIGIYEETMALFAENGYLTFGIDMLGHGKTATKTNSLGKINGENPFLNLVEDVNRAFIYIFDNYAPKKIEKFTRSYKTGVFSNKEKSTETIKPPIHALIGIGFGSSIVKNYSIIYKDVNCVVLCGDKGYETRDFLHILKAKSLIKKYGADASADEFAKTVEEKYSKESKTDYRFEYKTSEITHIRDLKKDKLCNFEYDLKSYKTILEMDHSLNLAEWVAAYPTFLATYVISGVNDPVNNKTKNMTKLVNYIRQNKLKNWFYKFYEGGHNLFIDSSRKEVVKDILTIVNAVKNQQYKNIKGE